MSILQRIYHFMLFSNLLIALAAAAQCLLTYVVLSQKTNWLIVGIEGAATLLLYNFSLFLAKPKKPQESPFVRTRWVFAHMLLFWLNSIFALLLLLYCLFFIHIYTWFFLGLIGLISLTYNLPILHFSGRVGGLRQVPGLKLFHIAVVWSLSSVGLPVVEMWASGVFVNWSLANMLGLLKILFLLICTLPFDIRDMKQDSLYRLKTIPHLLGENKAKILSYALIVAHIALLSLSSYPFSIKIGMIATDILIAIVLNFVLFKEKAGYNQVYLLDVALIVQYVFVLIFI